MRKYLVAILASLAALVSCSERDALYIQLPGTVWEITVDNTTTWLCFEDDTHASIVQYSTSREMSQNAHGTYTVDGHLVVIEAGGSEFKAVRTFSNLKHFSNNHNYTKISPNAYSSIAGSVWVVTEDNNMHVAYFPDNKTCLESTYTNISREDGDYGWAGTTSTCTLDGDKLSIKGLEAILYKEILVVDTLGVKKVCDATEGGDSSLKGTVWTYNNTGSPADVPSIIVFNGKDTFVRISSVWTGNLSTTRVNSYVFAADSGKYTEEGGTIKFEINGEEKSCPVTGDSFDLFEKTYKKLTF